MMMMMIRNPRDKVPQAKEEAGLGGEGDAGAPASSRIWTGLRNPRIVRVARSLGGKDRHSKVSTIRGLRDRRVRLSVPTAIQLYDLQDRLGLNQPSKVVDWLLDAAQNEIDKLPPLQIPPGSFLQCPAAMAASNGGAAPPEEPPSGPPPMAASMEYRAKRRDPTRGTMEEKDRFFRMIEGEQRAAEAHGTVNPIHGALYRQSHASMPSMGGGSSGEHASCYHMEAPNLCVPHLLCHPSSQGEELHGYGPANLPLPSTFSPYAAAAAAASAGYDHKQANSFQMGLHGFMLGSLPSSLTSTCTNTRPLQVSISSKRHHSQDGRGSTAE